MESGDNGIIKSVEKDYNLTIKMKRDRQNILDVNNENYLLYNYSHAM